MTTRTEWAIGIVGGLALVAVLMTAPPWMVIPVIAAIYIAYRALEAREK